MNMPWPCHRAADHDAAFVARPFELWCNDHIMEHSLRRSPRAALAEVLETYRELWHTGGFVRALLVSAAMLAIGVTLTVFAGFYATEKASNNVTDIILSNIPSFDVDGLFVYGTFFAIAFATFVVLRYPRYIPFVLSTVGMFYLIRSGFLVMTHIAPYPTVTSSDFGTTITKFFFGADLFFSGHTGAPFLLALIFWRERIYRVVFLILSVFFAVVVLIGHLHYTIDVASAFFITYTIYHIALRVLPRQYAIFAVASDPFVPQGHVASAER